MTPATNTWELTSAMCWCGEEKAKKGDEVKEDKEDQKEDSWMKILSWPSKNYFNI
jgi:hypothetical protein